MVYLSGIAMFYLLVIFGCLNKLCEGYDNKRLYLEQCVLRFVTPDKNEELNTCSACNMEEDINNKEMFYDSTSKDYYFDSYAHFGVHEDMLKDFVRTGTYEDAICKNQHLFKDKIVLDIGCGTGILSLFAARAGAAKVIGIDCSNIVKFAKEIVKANQLDHIITIIKAKLEELEELPEGIQKVDIIVSEWMGYSLLYESMLPTILKARDKWLARDGLIFPDKAVLYIAAIEDQEYKEVKVNFWDNVYGFNMSVIKNTVIMEPSVDSIDPNKIITSNFVLKELDLYTITERDLIISKNFTLYVRRNDYIHAMITYFTVHFTHCHTPITLSTAPEEPPTHWKQTIFYFNNYITAKFGNVLTGKLVLKQNNNLKRDLDVVIQVDYTDDFTNFHESNYFRLR